MTDTLTNPESKNNTRVNCMAFKARTAAPTLFIEWYARGNAKIPAGTFVLREGGEKVETDAFDDGVIMDFRHIHLGMQRSEGIAGQVTGIGSMMMLHLTDAPLQGPEDSNKVDNNLRGLVHLALIERGYYVARRNMIVLSLPMTAAQLDGFVEAFGDVLRSHRSVLPQAAH